MKHIKTEIEFVREIVRHAIWDVLYHERELKTAYRMADLAREAMSKGEFKYESPEYDTEGEPQCETIEQYMSARLDLEKENVEYHEKGMKEGQANMALVKIMLARGDYTDEEVNFDEITNLVKKQLAN